VAFARCLLAAAGELDFKEAGPELAGDEEAVMGCVPGDAVEYSIAVRVLNVRQEAGEVDPAKDVAGLRRDAGDAIGEPDIGEDLAMDVFELIELVDGLAMIADADGALDSEGGRIEKTQSGCAVAEDKLLAVLREAPALAGVVLHAQRRERGAVVEEGAVGLPGELDERVAPAGEALCEELRGDVAALDGLSGGEVFFPKGGLAVKAGAFVEVAVKVDEALGEGLRVMRVGVDNAIALRGERGAGQREAGERGEQAKERHR
jgi:hypothetical protein